MRKFGYGAVVVGMFLLVACGGSVVPIDEGEGGTGGEPDTSKCDFIMDVVEANNCVEVFIEDYCPEEVECPPIEECPEPPPPVVVERCFRYTVDLDNCPLVPRTGNWEDIIRQCLKLEEFDCPEE